MELGLHNDPKNCDVSMSQGVKAVEAGLSMKYYTIEYSIVVHLYEKFDCNAADILDNATFSETSFFYTLRKLLDMGVVEVRSDPLDLRSKFYSLSSQVRMAIDNAHRRIVELGLLLN